MSILVSVLNFSTLKVSITSLFGALLFFFNLKNYVDNDFQPYYIYMTSSNLLRNQLILKTILAYNNLIGMNSAKRQRDRKS